VTTGEDLVVEEWNYGDMVENHYQSRGYLTANIDGIPFTSYDSDA
jgi:hypothetical protein